MRNIKYLIYITVFLIASSLAISTVSAEETKHPAISGNLQNGYRVLSVHEDKRDIRFTVYRGDYIKFDVKGAIDKSLLEIPSLLIRQVLNPDMRSAPYFKMKKVGSYPFTIGEVSGLLDVVEYEVAQYQKLTADEAARLIKNIAPVILDVRTLREHNAIHLANSILIPVQELQQRYPELLRFKNADVFIYCATGNRSTVAAKILIDKGFTHIHNLQYGVYDWAKNGYPVVRAGAKS